MLNDANFYVRNSPTKNCFPSNSPSDELQLAILIRTGPICAGRESPIAHDIGDTSRHENGPR
jgi:hypothetical protein